MEFALLQQVAEETDVVLHGGPKAEVAIITMQGLEAVRAAGDDALDAIALDEFSYNFV